MTHKTEVNFSIPKIEDLYCINCKVNPTEFQDSIVKTLFHCQILTCRLIIYTVRCCIASPSIQNAQDLIHIIVSKKFFTTQKLQNYLIDLKVKFTDPEPVHPKIYQACLKYTFSFKLAPIWNAVGKSFYLNGFNFLSLPSNVNAVEWTILFKEKETKLEIKPMKMNLIPLTVELLSLPTSIVDNFMTNPYCNTNSINLTLFRCPWVYVLPKLTKARVVSVSKILPESCSFDNYNDLRRHWKNMYSYRLPKTDEGMLFYEVVFPLAPNQQFTYPEVCVLSKMPEILMCEDKNKVTSQFITDLTTKVHSICGEIMKVGRLFPELNIEHSFIFKKKINNCSKLANEYQTSSFFKTPDDCSTVKPLNKKMSLSSAFTYKEKKKLKMPMTDESQNIFTSMYEKTKKNKKLSNEEIGIDEEFRKYMSSVIRCEVDTDEVISYYDLPWMIRSDEAETELNDYLNNRYCCVNDTVEDEYENLFKSNLKNVTSDCVTHKKPVVKNVENVDLNLPAFKKFGTFYCVNQPTLALEKEKHKQVDQNDVVQNLFKRKHDFTYDSNIANKNRNSLQDNGSESQHKLSNKQSSIDHENKNSSKKILSSFDSHNIAKVTNDESHSIMNMNSKISPQSYASQEFDINHENSPMNHSLNVKQLNLFESQNFNSLLSKSETISHLIKETEFDNNLKEKTSIPNSNVESQQIIHFNLINQHSFHEEKRCNDLKSELLSNHNSKTIFDGDLFQNIETKNYFKNANEQNSNDHFFNSQSSSSTNFMLEGLVDEKSQQSYDSPIATDNLQSLQNLEKYNSPKYDLNSDNNKSSGSQYSPSIIDKSKESTKLFVKFNQSMKNKSVDEYNFNSPPQNEKFNKVNTSLEEDFKSTNEELLKSKANFNKNDFANLLSESSDEADFGTYEGYKQAYTESLTFY